MSTQAKVSYTPGPWESKAETNYVPAQVWADGRQLAEVYGEDRATRKANARLIAKAPEMAEALKGIREFLVESGTLYGDGYWSTLIERILREAGVEL